MTRITTAIAAAASLIFVSTELGAAQRCPQRGMGRARSVLSCEAIEKVGPDGAGAPRFVRALDGSYTIFFENPSSAPGPARTVVVVDELSPSLDGTTVGLGEVALGSQVVADFHGLPAGRARVRLAGTGLVVEISADYDALTHRLEWVLRTVDPRTGEGPDHGAGLLPPNDGTGRGTGHVTFSVKSRAGLATGAAIADSASVVLDTNAPIATNVWLNTIDSAPPTSGVGRLPSLSPARFTVQWQGADDEGGSGVGAFAVFVSDNGGPFVPWLSATAVTRGTYSGSLGHTYSFFTVATDQVGNVEVKRPVAEGSTVVVGVNQPPVADAGDPSVAECAGTTGANVQLDGTGSSDPDGGNLSYAWSAQGIGFDDPTSATPSADFPLGETIASLVVNDGSVDSEPDTTTVTVEDTIPPDGGLTSPASGACFGPTALPVAIGDNFADLCDPALTRSYVPPDGSYSDHGDLFVLATATDASGNDTTRTVGFTIDTMAPAVAIAFPVDGQYLPPANQPFVVTFASSDDDGAEGGVVREVLKISGCLALDGATYGDRDGLLSDEGIALGIGNFCRVASRCGVSTLTNPEIRIEATDCGGNIGAGASRLRGTISSVSGVCTVLKHPIAIPEDEPLRSLERFEPR